MAVAEADALPAAMHLARDHAARVDEACSRFRADSELSRLNQQACGWVTVGPVLATALGAALWAAEASEGLVDPTVGGALVQAGYDRDFAALIPASAAPVGNPARTSWRDIEFDLARSRARTPVGVSLDLGATAKALFADQAATQIAAVTGCGVLVSAGGDLAMAGPTPPGGWAVGVAEHHAGAPTSSIVVEGGGIATSGTSARTWQRGQTLHHHVIDPRTGRSADTQWRTATVAAATALGANVAATASVVIGIGAPEWLSGRGLAALLVSRDGIEVRVGGWPDAEACSC